MSIPGLGVDVNVGMEDVSSAKPAVRVTIPQGSEWRFEVPFKSILNIKVVEGVGEIFGTELPNNVDLQFSGAKYAVYAPLDAGCVLEYTTYANPTNTMTSEDDELVEYISEETAMNNYINLHLALDSMRQEAGDNNILNPGSLKVGPKVLIIGNKSCGKSTLAKILVSYAVKTDNVPILVNLNPRDGVFSLPGSLTATPISDRLDVESVNGYGFSTTSGSLFHNPKQPIVKNYGFTEIQQNVEHYKYQISKLGVAVLSRMEEDLSIRNAGFIIDTPSLGIKDFNVIENIVSDFEVNVIVVMGNERLSIDLKKKFKHKLESSQLNILKVRTSGGVVELDEGFIRRTQEATIKEYFNGTLKARLSPFKTEIDSRDLVIYKTVLASDINSTLSFLPAGDSYEVDTTTDKLESNILDKYYSLLAEPSSSNLDNSIVAISHLPQNSKQPKDLLNSSILGYVHVSKVDEEKGKLKILLPFPGAFPRNVLLATNIGFTE